MKRLKYYVGMFVFSLLVAAPVFTVATAPTAAAAEINCEPRFAGIPPWYRGMTVKQTNPSTGQEECVIKSPGDGEDNVQNFVLKLAFNIIEIGLVLAGYVALFFILYGGFQFLTNGSEPAAVVKARMTILNAVIGLAISLGAVGIINLVFGILG